MQQQINTTANNVKSETLISLQNIKKSYGSKEVLRGITLEIKKGDRIGVIGTNGAGKSTLSEVISGIRKPTSGHLDVTKNTLVGIQFQQSKYPVGISVYDLIKYYLEVYHIEMKKSELDDLMIKYQIIEFKNRAIEKLSGGQQQRVNILLSLIHNPDLVIFDEISTGLDIEVRQEIFDFIKENVIDKNKALMLVTHNMNEIEEMCNKFIYVDNGVIVEQGLVSEIVAEYGSVQNYT
ncbi:hypothetical protein Zmor_024840 [Zophobas morio]|uniref:ABC transporter domain-containing protein n=1 Tax=Zophobas morio TaxID=2755281 RepID=A0AA38M1C3_9CUCU|nr:hypothetical protein Zmor_024840 [Zophobas morio]